MTVSLAVLAEAADRVGIAAERPDPIRLGENAIYRLCSGVVARVGRAGQLAAARKEVAVSHWLAANSVPAIQALDVKQPVSVGDRPVTFWQELPPHRPGSHLDLALVLRRLHELPAPDGILRPLDPFVRLAQRIDVATTLTADDRDWLAGRLAELRHDYRNLPPGLPAAVIHGDAYGGNVVVTDSGITTLLDLERFSIGPPEWDLILTAIKRAFGGLTAENYGEFCLRYGHDVTTWSGFTTLRDIRELRMALYVAQLSGQHPDAPGEAANRVACLRGQRGPRPWSWRPM